jgi:branched-chain amino acid aminotransferase
MKYHVDGDLVAAADATVSVRDRGFRYGDGAFETLRVYGGDIFEWDAHVDRLAETCAVLSLDHGLSRAALRERIDATLAANDLDEAAVRLSITRGVQPGRLTPAREVDPTVVVTASALPRGGTDGEPVWDDPAAATVADTRRVPDASLPARAKTHNYLNGILARIEAREVGADEALLCDDGGTLTEGATCNLFFVTDDTLRTPALDGPVLPGVTRRVVLDLAREADLSVETGAYTPADLRAADEAFLTNTTWELRPLAAVDGTAIGGGPVTDRLQRDFDALVQRRHYDE